MEKNDCKEGVISSLFTVAAVSVGAYCCYRMARNLITFLAVFDAPVTRCEQTGCDEIDESAAGI